MPAAYFADVARGFSHPEYPLFLPMNEMWLYLWMGEPNQYWIKLIFSIFYGAGMVLLARAAFAFTGKRWIGLLVAALFLFVPWIYGGPGGIVVGYVDVPLGFFYLGAIYSLIVLVKKTPAHRSLFLSHSIRFCHGSNGKALFYGLLLESLARKRFGNVADFFARSLHSYPAPRLLSDFDFIFKSCTLPRLSILCR